MCSAGQNKRHTTLSLAKGVPCLHCPRSPHEPKALPVSLLPDGWQGLDWG